MPESVTRPDSSRYGSGSECEFEGALDGQKADGKPDMLVYRKTAEPTVAITSRESVLGCLEQHEQLQNFIGKWFTGSDGTIAGVYHAFGTTDDFEAMGYDFVVDRGGTPFLLEANRFPGLHFDQEVCSRFFNGMIRELYRGI